MKLSESEWLIMNALWTDHPATAREVLERLPENVDWAYTTVKTMLTRLEAKGAVGERKSGNTSVYEPLVSQEKARSSAIRRLVDHAFGGALGPLVGFLAEDRELGESERRELRELLEIEEQRDGGEA